MHAVTAAFTLPAVKLTEAYDSVPHSIATFHEKTPIQSIIAVVRGA